MTVKIKDENEESSSEQFLVDLGEDITPIHEKIIEPIEYAITKFQFQIRYCEDTIEDSQEQIKHYKNKIIEYKNLIEKIKE